MTDRRSGAAPEAERGPGVPGREGLPVIAQPPETRKQKLAKAALISVWMVFLGAPVRDLGAGDHSGAAVAGGVAGLLAFVVGYMALVFRHTAVPLPPRSVATLLGTLYGLGLLLSLTLGDAWLVLFVYVAVAAGAVLPVRQAVSALIGVVVALAAVGTGFGARPWWGVWTSFIIPVVLGGYALMSARRTVRTLRELREARAAVARLAANEERLRLARDLHDLLGHSLSVITLKSELAGRMLPGDPGRAAEQVADIEQVSRQALVDVREAVSGYRRPTLPVELAGARTALAAAGIAADLPAHDSAPAGPRPWERLPAEQEAALAWALREAVTNVVRHSGASRCTVTLDPAPADSRADARAEGAGEGSGAVTLTVRDDGSGPAGTGHGSGLDGLRERLTGAGGTLETSAGERGGFTLRATVPSVP